jgi:integrase
MAELSEPRAHLKSAVIVALGTGMRLGEQLRMKRSQVDFLRNIVTARNTKNGKRVAVEAIKLSSRKSVHKLATNEIRPPVLAAVNR